MRLHITNICLLGLLAIPFFSEMSKPWQLFSYNACLFTMDCTNLTLQPTCPPWGSLVWAPHFYKPIMEQVTMLHSRTLNPHYYCHIHPTPKWFWEQAITHIRFHRRTFLSHSYDSFHHGIELRFSLASRNGLPKGPDARFNKELLENSLQ